MKKNKLNHVETLNYSNYFYTKDATAVDDAEWRIFA